MDTFDKLKNIFRDFPTVGSRTAGRFVYYLIKLPKERIDELVNAVLELKNKIKLCELCFSPFEPLNSTQGNSQNTLCLICQNPTKNKNILCIVAHSLMIKYLGWGELWQNILVKEKI